MKVVSKEEFLKLPAGTVYQKYDPKFCGFIKPICIKGKSLTQSKDFIYISLLGDFEEANDSEKFIDCVEAVSRGENKELCFDVTSRDGMFDDNDKYAVWTDNEVQKLISTLQQSLKDKTDAISSTE